MVDLLSSSFVRTLREDPADAEVPSHRLLLRAGYVRRVAPGGYAWLPLGLKVPRNVERVVREEMDRIGARETSYSFDLDHADPEKSYAAHRDAYQRIFARLGVDVRIVSALSGAMGGTVSEEFPAPTPVGEDTFVTCAGCGYAANTEAVTESTLDGVGWAVTR